MPKTDDTTRTVEDVAEFCALSMMAEKHRVIMDNLVEEVCYFTGESGDEDGMSNTVAWDVVHNGVELKHVLRRCKLTLEKFTDE